MSLPDSTTGIRFFTEIYPYTSPDMKRTLTVFLCCFIAVSLYAQKSGILVVRPAVKDIDALEQKFNSKKQDFGSITFTVSKDYFPNSDKYSLAQPLMYDRGEAVKDPSVSYFYSQPDNIVRLIEYTWNARAEYTKDLQAIFDQNKKVLSKHFGSPGAAANEKHDTWQQTSIVWENATTHVKQFMVTGSGTYRVRVLVSWKN